MLGFHHSRRLLAALLITVFSPLQGQSLPSSSHSGGGNETLIYNIEWRLITAGNARIDFNGSHLLLKLESTGLVSKLYKVDDTYNVSYDPGICATSSHLEATEGRRKRDTRVTWDRAQKHADYLERDLIKNSVVKSSRIDTPQCTHDVIGALIALRNNRVDLGHSLELPVSDGKKVAMVRVEAQEREQLKIKGAPVSTVRYEAFLFNGVIYARKARMFVWLTDDARKLPVQLQLRMNFPIGTVTLTLDKEEHQ
jgi:hypothetical protein